MKAFVEFERETSDTKSTSHAEFKTWLKLYLTRVLSTGGGGGGEASPQNVLLKKKLPLFQIKIFFDDDFKESVKVTNVQKCDFSQS